MAQRMHAFVHLIYQQTQPTPGRHLQVDVSEEEEEFQGLVTACLGVLLLGTETRLDAGLQAMIRVNWSAVETVGDPYLSPSHEAPQAPGVANKIDT